ncbi:sel1 repeat family protein [Streptomyces sp. Rer75]|uniref:sel1 repeat family protein n=1 Tax=Streptomyces sp. Rer75 TaxID=2750011 RepID=UPI0015CFCC93|nr:sel1 repeat family protein [Streptomyces sp. Rer75]QLH20564.1 sel1 repeat family protein [Streptomyces sp. Rer75]
MGDVLADLRRVGEFKRCALRDRPSNRELARLAEVAPGTPGTWLHGANLPQDLGKLIVVLGAIRTEAARTGALDGPVDDSGKTAAELLDPGRWRAAFAEERERRVEDTRSAVERRQARAALVEDERRARQAALADRPRPVGAWSAQRLGVHPAIPGRPVGDGVGGGRAFVLPRYVLRPHDERLRGLLSEAVAAGARPSLIVVAGGSCTGKSRTAFEGLRAAVSPDVLLLFPVDPAGLLDVLAAEALGPGSVLWLNEAQDYLTGPRGEAVAAALLRRLDGEGPLAVVATLRPEHLETLRGAGHCHSHGGGFRHGGPDQHWLSRALLAQAAYVHVPRTFAEGLESARELACEDVSLAVALDSGLADLTQVLAAGPDLVDFYEHPVGEAGIHCRAVLGAAMDAHRLGVTGPLPLAFLEAAAPGYLDDDERAVGSEWFTRALARARTVVKQTTSPLQNVARPGRMGIVSGMVRLADFLQQHGDRTRRTVCPPASFWDAAAEHLTDATDLHRLACAAQQRARLRHAAVLYAASADAGNPSALFVLAMQMDRAEDHEMAHRLIEAAAAAGEGQAASELAWRRMKAGESAEADRILRDATDAVRPDALARLALRHELSGDRVRARRLYLAAAELGNDSARRHLDWEARWEADRNAERREALEPSSSGAEDTALFVLEDVDSYVLRHNRPDADPVTRWFLEYGSMHELFADAHERKGNRKEAERLYQAAGWLGNSKALRKLAQWAAESGHPEKAERLYLAVIDTGDDDWLFDLASSRGEPVDSYERHGIEADGTLSESWPWPVPRAVGLTTSIEPEREGRSQPG